jgi:putative ABC transport system permease protein
MPPWTDAKQNRRNQDLEDEIAHDLELETEELVRRGMPRPQAENASRRDFGNVLRIKEKIRERWVWTWAERLAQDLRFTARVTVRNPGFTATVLVTLALGIGIATALFSVVYGLILAPYPYQRPGEILDATLRSRDAHQVMLFRVSQYLEIVKLPAVSGVLAECPENELLAASGGSETVHGTLLSGDAFRFLGAQPLLGRTIQPADIHPDGQAEPVVVLSYNSWQRWFHGDPRAVGKRLVLNDRARTVIGIMPPRFGWHTDIWMPLPLDRYDRLVALKVRLAAGVSRQSAVEQVHALLTNMALQDPAGVPRAGFTIRLDKPAWDKAGRGIQSAMGWLMLVAGLLLLIACVSVANLQLARGAERSLEIAVRMSMGAGPARVLRQLFTENLALALAGGALGVPFAVALLPAIAALLPNLHTWRPDDASIALDRHVLMFALAASMLAGVLCGLAPVMQSWRLRLAEALKDAPGASARRMAGAGARSLLASAQVAISVILLSAGIITVRGFVTVVEQGRGFEHVRVLKAGYALSPKIYPGYYGRMLFARNLLARLQELPAVQAAAIGTLGNLQSFVAFPEKPEERVRRVDTGFISSAFTAALGIPLRAGRAFSEQEIEDAARVALVNERAAALLWPRGSPIGKRIRLDLLDRPADLFLLQAAGPPEGTARDVTIVGVIGDLGRNDELGIMGGPLVLVPYTLAAPTRRELFLRTAGNPMALWKPLRREIAAIDREEGPSNPWTFDGSLGSDQDKAVATFEMALFGLVALAGLVLSAAGIYSVLSCSVARQTHEVGIRMALGATPRHVLAGTLRAGSRSVGIGLAAGIAGSMLLASQLETKVPKLDLLALAAIGALLVPPAIIACYLPARRAARLDPAAALRHE